jgi:hypothetical protein
MAGSSLLFLGLAIWQFLTWKKAKPLSREMRDQRTVL